MRHQPLRIGAVAMEAAAEVIVDAAHGHGSSVFRPSALIVAETLPGGAAGAGPSDAARLAKAAVGIVEGSPQ